MIRFGIAFACLTVAAPALAQEQASGMPPQIQSAAQAFGQCVGTAAATVAPSVTPEAGAKTVLAGCATQQAALESAVESFIAGSGMPEAEMNAARGQLRAELAKAETEIAQMIRQRRAAPAAPSN